MIEAFRSTHNFDFLCFSETFLDSTIHRNNGNIKTDSFSILRAHHTSNSKREVGCIFFKQILQLIRKNDLNTMHETIVTEITVEIMMIIIICKRWVILHHRGNLGQTPPHSKKLCLCHPIALLRSIGSKVQIGGCQGQTPIYKVPIAVAGKAVALCKSEIDNNLLPIPYYSFVLLFFRGCLNLTCYLLSPVISLLFLFILNCLGIPSLT